MSNVAKLSHIMRQRVVGGLLLSSAVSMLFWIYLPGMGGGYLLDDFTSVVHFSGLAESPQSFWAYVFGERSGPFGRPVSAASFALENIFLDGSSETSKKISLGIHAFNMVLVFWLTFEILRPCLRTSPMLLALLVAIFWAFSPQKVSTVLYIVQRMAMLSALFILLALLSYFYFRTAARKHIRLVCGLLCALFILLAPFAKENGALVVPLILCLEYFVISRKPTSHTSLNLSQEFSGYMLALMILAYLLAGLLVAYGLFYGYEARPFTLQERLLTQPVALFDYISQFYYPDIAPMGVVHDDFPVVGSIAGSLKAPLAWLTLCACILLLVVSTYTKRFLLVGLSVSFFFVGHSLESGFLPLEIYFEHRNYLPSIGLALLPALFVIFLAQRIGERLVRPLCFVGLLALLPLLGSTSALVLFWSEGSLLKLHAYQNHPKSPRAVSDYALILAQLGSYEKSAELIESLSDLSRDSKSVNTFADGDVILLKVAASCLSGRGMPQAEVDRFRQVSQVEPVKFITPRLLASLAGDKSCPNIEWEYLERALDRLYFKNGTNHDASFLVFKHLAAFEATLQNCPMALKYAESALSLVEDDVDLILIKLGCFIRLQEAPEAEQTIGRLTYLGNQGKVDSRHLATFDFYKKTFLERFSSPEGK
ncbi:MAG: tetratricopeptide repeat protein [Halioglobus sp.]